MSGEVKRYRFKCAGGGWADAHLDEERSGDLVRYDDYAAALARVAEVESVNAMLSAGDAAYNEACGALPSYCDPNDDLADSIRWMDAALATERAAREQAEAQRDGFKAALNDLQAQRDIRKNAFGCIVWLTRAEAEDLLEERDRADALARELAEAKTEWENAARNLGWVRKALKAPDSVLDTELSDGVVSLALELAEARATTQRTGEAALELERELRQQLRESDGLLAEARGLLEVVGMGICPRRVADDDDLWWLDCVGRVDIGKATRSLWYVDGELKTYHSYTAALTAARDALRAAGLLEVPR